jgi:Tfp pilus assembly protein PilF
LTGRSAASDASRQRTSTALAASARDETNWWTWVLRASAENNAEKKQSLYELGIRLLPNSIRLHGNFAIFLSQVLKDFDAAEAMHKKALKLDPEHANITGNYANFLARDRKNLDAAEVMYKKALKLDPENASITGNYAFFLSDVRKDFDAAEALYKKALELDPEDANPTANFAALELARGAVSDIDSAGTHAAHALSLSRPNPRQTAAEALLYLSLCAELMDGDVALQTARLKKLLQIGFDREDWDFFMVFETILSRIQEDRQALYEAMGAAILDADLVPALDEFDEWKALEPIDPFEPL